VCSQCSTCVHSSAKFVFLLQPMSLQHLSELRKSTLFIDIVKYHVRNRVLNAGSSQPEAAGSILIRMKKVITSCPRQHGLQQGYEFCITIVNIVRSFWIVIRGIKWYRRWMANIVEKSCVSFAVIFYCTFLNVKETCLNSELVHIYYLRISVWIRTGDAPNQSLEWTEIIRHPSPNIIILSISPQNSILLGEGRVP